MGLRIFQKIRKIISRDIIIIIILRFIAIPIIPINLAFFDQTQINVSFGFVSFHKICYTSLYFCFKLIFLSKISSVLFDNFSIRGVQLFCFAFRFFYFADELLEFVFDGFRPWSDIDYNNLQRRNKLYLLCFKLKIVRKSLE